MKISKFQAANGRCLIKSNTYAHDYEYVIDLIKIALRDFPYLKYRDIQIKVYDDDRWSKQMGIEFSANAPHPDYLAIDKLPKTYN